MRTGFRRHFVIAVLAATYLFTLLLIVQQGRTIDSQRTFIHPLFHDSLERNAMKVQHIQDTLQK